ncbi:hypothetical protein JCM33374_g4229 [Metschnikowia sp. JCM 33374]|nr:hypothetical protein JCM33374_g4229 [Metschnikowia sp. JCM 33374]
MESESETVQSIVQNFLESDLLSSACEVWNQEKLPSGLESEISDLFNLVTQTIFEGCGDLTSGLQYRDSHTNELICSFYHKLYKAALESNAPRLASETNIAISEKLVEALAKNQTFVLSFFDHHGCFLPYVFFVQHIRVFFGQVAHCLTLCKDDQCLQLYIRDNLALLVKKVTWGDMASLWEQENAWKLLFFCEVLQGNPINESSLLLFDSFLHSIDSWKVLFEVCLYFLNMVSHNPSIDSIIAEAADTRMVLVMKNSIKDPLTEQEELVVWDFICKVLECKSFDLIMGLFYDASVGRDQTHQDHVLRKFRTNAHKLMSTDAWFVETFTNCFPDFCKMAIPTRHCNVEWSPRKSLSCFFISGIHRFLSNSLITNRFIYSVTIHLLTFDCCEVNSHPLMIIDSLAELLESVDEQKFREAKDSMAETDGASQTLRTHLRMQSAPDIEDVERPLSNEEKLRFKNEGMRQNFYLLEAISATLYAAIKAKHITFWQNNGSTSASRSGWVSGTLTSTSAHAQAPAQSSSNYDEEFVEDGAQDAEM